MIYKRFGKTELQMPLLTCGGMRFQYKWKDKPMDQVPEANQKNLEAVVRRALELGINHFETARGYGTSEMQLGRVFKGIDRDKIIIQTKVAPKENTQEFEERFATSLDYLGMDYVDLFSIHGVNNEEIYSWMVRKGGCLDKALQHKKEGRFRFLGFSTHGHPDLIHKILDLGVFDYVNLHWYYVNPFTLPLVEKAASMDMGVLIISPNDKGGRLFHPTPKMLDLCHPLSPMMFNDLYCLSNPAVGTLSIGAAQPQDFDEHVHALELVPRAPQSIAPLLKKLKKAIEDEFCTGWMENWHKEIPYYLDIPGEVNVFEILRLWTYAKGLDLFEFGQARYSMLSTNSTWFPGNNAAHADLKTIGERLRGHPHLEEILGILKEAHLHLYDAEQHRKNLG